MAGHRIFAALYDRLSRPLEEAIVGPRRAALLGDLTGDVLDVGAGTGANLPHLRSARQVVAAEPDPAMRAKLRAKLGTATVPVEVVDAGGEALPFPDAAFDAVVFTLVLCTIPDPAKALAEAARVLRDDGRIVVLEHVRGEGTLARWQDRLVPVWSWLGAGCHPNRDTAATIESSGFSFVDKEEFTELPHWVPTSPMLSGVAVPRKSA